MQGQHHYQPELFSQIDYESLIPKSHLLRRIDKVLNLSFLRELTAPLYANEKGRPSIDPEIFVRMLLLKHLYDINSDRQLSEEVGYNLAYRWFCRLSLTDQVPDHSSLTKIRDRLGEKTFERIFMEVLKQCSKSGLTKGDRIIFDGTPIRADAAKKSLVPRDPNDPTDYDHPNSPSMNNTTHVSATDPEATLYGKGHEIKALGYKSHTAIDADSRVILDCHVTTGMTHESTVFIDRVDHLRNEMGYPIAEVIADRGFGSGQNFHEIQKRSLQSFIPCFHTPKRKEKTFDPKRFTYDNTNDRYQCSEGHWLYPMNMPSMPTMKRYRIIGDHCQVCPQSENCLPKDHAHKRSRRFNVHIHQALLDEMAEKEKSTEFKSKMYERRWKVEGIFAEGKTWHGLGRAQYRGRWKVQAQVYVVSTVQNLKRLASFVLHWLKAFITNLSSQSFPLIFFQKVAPILKLEP